MRRAGREPRRGDRSRTGARRRPRRPPGRRSHPHAVDRATSPTSPRRSGPAFPRSSSTARHAGSSPTRSLVDNRRGAREAVEHLVSAGAHPRRRARRPDQHPHRRRAARGLRGGAQGRRRQARPGTRRHRSAHRPRRRTRRCTRCWPVPTRRRRSSPARNILSIGAIRALRRAGPLATRSPSSGSTTSRSPTSSTPSLTVVRQDVREIGRQAAELLFARIDGDTSPPHRIVSIPTLVVRGSGEIPPPGRR